MLKLSSDMTSYDCCSSFELVALAGIRIYCGHDCLGVMEAFDQIMMSFISGGAISL